MPAPIHDIPPPQKDTQSFSSGSARPNSLSTSALVDPNTVGSSQTASLPRSASASESTQTHQLDEDKTSRHPVEGQQDSSPALSTPTSSPTLRGQTKSAQKDPKNPLFRPWKHGPGGPLQTFTLPEASLHYQRHQGQEPVSPIPLPPFISPADSPIDRPSTPHHGRDEAHGLSPLSHKSWSERLTFAIASEDNRERAVRTPSHVQGEFDLGTPIPTKKGSDKDLRTSSEVDPINKYFQHGSTSPRKHLQDAQRTLKEILDEERRKEGHEDSEHPVLLDEPRHISAIMANESSSRSRKGSQRLGLFKENSKAIEEREREKQKREDRNKEKEKERLEKLEKRRAKERDEQLKESVAKGKLNAAVPSLKSLLVEQLKAHIPQETRPDSVAVPRTKDDKISSSSRDVASSEAFPGDLSSSQSAVPDAPCPQVAQADLSAHIDAKRLRAPSSCGFNDSESSDQPPGSPASSYTSTITGRKKSENGHAIGSDGDDSERTASDHNDDDDDDAEDEISSAVYFPHNTPSVTRTPSTTALPKIPNPEPYATPARRPDAPQREVAKASSAYGADEDSEFELSIQNGPDESFYHGARKHSTEEDATGGYVSAASTAISELEYSENSEYYESSTDDIERSAAQDDSDVDVTPNAAKWKQSQAKHHAGPSQQYKHDKRPEAPLGAVELKPYKHQVGGHTALFRFSKKAICKSLSNRENEFYEAIETRHPELLRFLPRLVVPPSPFQARF